MPGALAPRAAFGWRSCRFLWSKFAAAAARFAGTREQDEGGRGAEAPALPGPIPAGRVEFQVQWVGWDGLAPRAIPPLTVPDEACALACVAAMPRPLLSAAAYRIEHHPALGETKALLAYRRNTAWDPER